MNDRASARMCLAVLVALAFASWTAVILISVGIKLLFGAIVGAAG